MALRILITGVNGFIGQRVARVLLDQGHDVVGLSLEQASAISSPHLRYHRLDITDLRSMRETLEVAGPFDALVHLAALVHVRDPRLAFSDYANVNYRASTALFHGALASGVRRIAFASTVEVYGPTAPNANVDENAPCRPDSDYARSKLLAEESLRDLAQRADADYCVLRLAPVYAHDFRMNVDKRLYLRAPWLAYQLGMTGSLLSLCSIHNIEAWMIRWLSKDTSTSGTFNLADRHCYSTQTILRGEHRRGRARIVLPIPRIAGMAAVAARAAICDAFGRDTGMLSIANFRKLANQPRWDTTRAIDVVGSLPGDLEHDLYSV